MSGGGFEHMNAIKQLWAILNNFSIGEILRMCEAYSKLDEPSGESGDSGIESGAVDDENFSLLAEELNNFNPDTSRNEVPPLRPRPQPFESSAPTVYSLGGSFISPQATGDISPTPSIPDPGHPVFPAPNQISSASILNILDELMDRIETSSRLYPQDISGGE